MRILLVEDDEALGDATRTGLTQFGYAVDWLKDGKSAELAINSEDFSIIILDIGLPGMSGLELLKKIRNTENSIPVLLLTAKDTVEDRVKGLDSGADDYLTKPFELEELRARIRALSRRVTSRANPIIEFGNIILDPASHAVTQNGEAVAITRREFALLQKLLDNAGRVLSREQLAQSLYSWEEDVDSNALEVHVHNLRKKFSSDFIHTIRGVGYMVKKKE